MSTETATRLTLKAPLSGVVVPIDAVPDPVFAQKMVGDGVSLDPISTSLLAPCDGRLIQLHSAGHAVTLWRNLSQRVDSRPITPSTAGADGDRPALKRVTDA